VQEENTITEEAKAAGVIRDVVLSSIGSSHRKRFLQQPVRLVVVEATKKDGTPYEIWLITDRLEMDADLIAIGYRYRWTVELFFRWFKQILGMRHLISDTENGVTIQLYVAMIASLLIVVGTGLKVNKRTWEMLQHYLIGWATLEELECHIRKQLAKQERQLKKAK
jgi:IS4 transposase